IEGVGSTVAAGAYESEVEQQAGGHRTDPARIHPTHLSQCPRNREYEGPPPSRGGLPFLDGLACHFAPHVATAVATTPSRGCDTVAVTITPRPTKSAAIEPRAPSARSPPAIALSHSAAASPSASTLSVRVLKTFPPAVTWNCAVPAARLLAPTEICTPAGFPPTRHRAFASAASACETTAS